jgi:hypothetical protein
MGSFTLRLKSDPVDELRVLCMRHEAGAAKEMMYIFSFLSVFKLTHVNTSRRCADR